jgi:dTDP-4-dehydrorhamnose 3,5-epimerase-like enzyme
MPKILTLPVHSSNRGDLTVFENILPGTLKRIFYITNADGETRGGHRHIKAWQALICVQGTCNIYVETTDKKFVFGLDEPNKVLVLEPQDWHTLENFSDNAIVLVVSNENYDPEDYIYPSYSETFLEDEIISNYIKKD